MEHQNSDHEERLCAYLFGELDAEERRQVEELLERDPSLRAELERRQAAAAAGAAPADPDAARGLAAVEADWTRSLAAMAEIDRQARALDESYREAGRHVHGLGRAAVEWAVALREVGKAMKREREQANLRLIEASVEELGA